MNSNCDQEIENATVCRPTCRDKLTETKNALGCCVNIYNDSYPYAPESLAYRGNHVELKHQSFVKAL